MRALVRGREIFVAFQHGQISIFHVEPSIVALHQSGRFHFPAY